MGKHHQTISKFSPKKIDKHHPKTVRPGGSVRSSCFSPDGEKILAAVRRDFSFFSPWEKDGHIWKPWESGILKLGFDLLTLIVFFPLVNPPFGAPTCGTFPAYFQFLSEKLLFDWAHR